APRLTLCVTWAQVVLGRTSAVSERTPAHLLDSHLRRSVLGLPVLSMLTTPVRAAAVGSGTLRGRIQRVRALRGRQVLRIRDLAPSCRERGTERRGRRADRLPCPKRRRARPAEGDRAPDPILGGGSHALHFDQAVAFQVGGVFVGVTNVVDDDL